MTRPVTIIYHANCPDGFGAAVAAWLFFKQQPGYKKKHLHFHKGKHGSAPPDCTDHSVYILDFSYKRKDMQKLCQRAHKVILIDHHISAYKELKDLQKTIPNLSLHFDMQQSGAVLSWKYFHTGPVQKLLKHIQDNDLWQFKLNNTRTIISALMSHPLKRKLWSSWLKDKQALKNLHAEGLILERHKKKQIRKYKQAAFMGNIAAYTVPIVNAPSSIGSELLNQLSAGHPFAVDVSEIAALFGGGGDQRASGFSTGHAPINLKAPVNAK